MGFNSSFKGLTAIGLTPGGSSTVHIYTQTIHRTTQLTILVGRLSGIRSRAIIANCSSDILSIPITIVMVVAERQFC